MPPELLAPGAVVFTPPDGVLDLVNVNQWWRYVAGADWRHPAGPDSSIEGRDNHPVVDVAYEDAQAYAHWLGRELPSEAQWEFAARGGLDGATYSWGEEYYDPVAGWRANTWQGLFPLKDDVDDGYHGTAPVGCFAPNGYGLFDMAGNVWEYARDWYVPGHPARAGDRSARAGSGSRRALRRPDGPVGRDQGRLVLVRAQLLRQVSSRRAPAAGARPRRQPPRFPHGAERPRRQARSARGRRGAGDRELGYWARMPEHRGGPEVLIEQQRVEARVRRLCRIAGGTALVASGDAVGIARDGRRLLDLRDGHAGSRHRVGGPGGERQGCRDGVRQPGRDDQPGPLAAAGRHAADRRRRPLRSRRRHHGRRRQRRQCVRGVARRRLSTTRTA